jgi:flagellin-like hook-associated protein FlgL
MAGIIATNAILKNDRDQETAMERLSTGLRINSASDDAAGLAISQRMSAEVSGLKMANRNANDAISMLETAEGASVEIMSILQRMRELALQSATDTNSSTDRQALDLEFGQMFDEMQSIASQTTWNTMTIMNGGAPGATDVINDDVDLMEATIQLGKNATQTTVITLKSWDPRNTLDAEAIPGRIARDGLAADDLLLVGARVTNIQAPEPFLVAQLPTSPIRLMDRPDSLRVVMMQQMAALILRAALRMRTRESQSKRGLQQVMP